MQPEIRKIQSLSVVKHFLLRLLILIVVYSLVLGLGIAFLEEGGLFLFFSILPIINILFFLILFIEAVFLKHNKQMGKMICNIIFLLYFMFFYIYFYA